MRISDWSSDVCSSDLASFGLKSGHHGEPWLMRQLGPRYRGLLDGAFARKRLVYGLSAVGLVLAGIAYGAVGKTLIDRKRVVEGKSVSVRVDLGCRRSIKKTRV